MTRSSAPIASATPDAFGYVLDDAVAFDWVDASTGTPSGLVGDDAFLGPTDIGFGFHFYEESYDTLYISTNGILSFGSGQAAYLNTSIPFPARPNAMVAALWADLCVRDGCNSGAVYYLRGGAAPNRFLVVEWHQISFQGDATPLTFEAILQENGDIVLQYSDLPAPLGTVTVGIEDASGQDGLQFASSRLASGSAIRFRRPSPSARVQVAPAYQSRFVHASQQASFALTIRNTGELGADTFDLEVSSVWSASLADAQGVALPDTNANGLPDTGPVPAGSAVNAVLMLTVPDSAARGDANSAMLDVHSSREPTRHKTVQLDACVPAGLAQILLDGSQDNIAVLLAQPWAVALQQLCPPGRGAESPAIAESANGDLVCVWSRGRWNATAYTFEIEYAFLTPGSSSTPSVRKLVDNSQAPGETWDKQPVLAATSHAQTAVAWVRKAFDSQFRESDNLYFALLNASGSLVRAPTNLTNNNSWGTWGDAGFADLSEPSIVALNDRFALAWQRETFVNEETVTDVFYALCQPTGGVVGGIQRLTSDTPGSDDGNSRPNLTAISGDRVLITWTRHADGEVYYAMLSNSGSVVRPAERLTADGLAMIDHDTDACELPDGHIVIAWEGGQSIRFAVLDSNFNRLVAPTSLQNPAAAFGSDSVSVVAAGNDAVLTWKDTGESYAPRLYYALVGRDGRVITPPQGFYSSSGSVVQTNSSGYGNTTYHAPSPTATQTSTVTPSPTTTRTSTATPTPTHTRALTPSPVRTETRPATPVRRTVYLPSILKPSALAH